MTKIKDLAQCKHPKSRKTNALLKQIKRENAREKNRKSSNIKLNILGEKISWFKDFLKEHNIEKPSKETVLELINKYLERFNDELKQINLKRSIGNRKNRQHASREDIINMTIKAEREEFNTCGLEIPDILNTVQFNLLKQWDGELRFISNFKLKRYSKKSLDSLKSNEQNVMDIN